MAKSAQASLPNTVKEAIKFCLVLAVNLGQKVAGMLVRADAEVGGRASTNVDSTLTLG